MARSSKSNTSPKPPAAFQRAKGVLVSVLCGCLWFLSCADFDIWPLAYIAMVPGFWVVENAPTRRFALFCGWLAGLVANLGGFYWVMGFLERFGHLPLPLAILGLLLLSAYQAVVFWLFFALVRTVRRTSKERFGKPIPMVLLAPIAMVTFERLVPFLFDWYLAITQAWVIPVVQLAELAGPLGVTAFLMVVNGAVYDVVTCEGRRRLMCGFAGVLVTAFALVYGFVRMAAVDEARAQAPSLRIGVVQGNIPFDEKGLQHPELATGQLRELQEKSAELEAQGAQFLMWTESSYPYAVPRDFTVDFPLHRRYRIRRGFTVPLMLGALTYDRQKPDEAPFNSALMLGDDDRFVARYDKNFLLMFGEYIPLKETFPIIEEILPRNASHFSRGKEVTTFPLEHEGTTYRLGPMICYEDILPAFGRRLAKAKPHLLVNITNDAWFGDTSEPWEHMALSVYRAVEMRTDLVRAVNTGVSAFIDANGRVVKETYALDPAITPMPVDGIVGEVRLVEGGHTFYARYGDVFAFLCMAVSLFFWLLLPRMGNHKA